jgi:uncharacterized membrane protein YhaH (DUF805 family)
MNFLQAISSGFSNYVGFSGRAVRSEYWFWALFCGLAGIVTGILDGMTGVPVTNVLFSLATILPSLALGVRRLHDCDRTGWWMLILLTGIGAILLIIWFCMEGTRGPNRFGPDRLAQLGQLSPHPAA